GPTRLRAPSPGSVPMAPPTSPVRRLPPMVAIRPSNDNDGAPALVPVGARSAPRYGRDRYSPTRAFFQTEKTNRGDPPRSPTYKALLALFSDRRVAFELLRARHGSVPASP